MLKILSAISVSAITIITFSIVWNGDISSDVSDINSDSLRIKSSLMSDNYRVFVLCSISILFTLLLEILSRIFPWSSKIISKNHSMYIIALVVVLLASDVLLLFYVIPRRKAFVANNLNNLKYVLMSWLLNSFMHVYGNSFWKIKPALFVHLLVCCSRSLIAYQTHDQEMRDFDIAVISYILSSMAVVIFAIQIRGWWLHLSNGGVTVQSSFLLSSNPYLTPNPFSTPTPDIQQCNIMLVATIVSVCILILLQIYYFHQSVWYDMREYYLILKSGVFVVFAIMVVLPQNQLLQHEVLNAEVS